MNSTATVATGASTLSSGVSRRRRRVFVVVAASVAALVVGLLADLLDVELVVRPGNDRDPMAIGAGLIGAFSFGAALAGWITLATLERWTKRASLLWTILATAVFVISLVPVAGAEAAGNVKLLLAAMHSIVAIVVIVGLRATMRSSARPSRQYRTSAVSS